VLTLGTSYGAKDQELELLLSSNNESIWPRRTILTNEWTSAQPKQEDFLEAADFGLRAMNDLYLVKEPKLYSMG
jgi:hypothetical protein